MITSINEFRKIFESQNEQIFNYEEIIKYINSTG